MRPSLSPRSHCAVGAVPTIALALTALASVPLSAQSQESRAAAKHLGARGERVTFTEHVAPIIFDNCASCHRPGESAPFALLDYASVRKRAKMIQRVTASRYMPPWHPTPGWGEFRDSRRLSDKQVDLIKRWVEGGRVEGPKAALPKLPNFVDGWQLGKPDMVVEMPKGYPVPASGPDIYRNFLVPLELPHDKWVAGLEIRPGAPSVLHHTLFWGDTQGRGRQREGRDGKPGFRGMSFRSSLSLGGWAVGGTPRLLPYGLAYSLPIESDLILASHFHPSGKAEVERTKVGLFFAKEPPKQRLRSFQVPPEYGAFWGIDIPAGESRYVVEDQFVVPCDLDLIGIGGHAHYICKSMKAVATLPSGEKRRLFRIDDWDFNWQGRYFYKDKVRLPKGTRVDSEIVYDNSAQNPRQQFDPPRKVRWGLQSTDEMGSVIFECVLARESDARAFRDGIRSNRAESGARAARRRVMAYDKNGDGNIGFDEIPERLRGFARGFDEDGDGSLSGKEIDSLIALFRRFGGGRRR